VTPQAGRLRILVVDDEPAILRFLRASLESQGYIVSTTADAVLLLDRTPRQPRTEHGPIYADMS
jgi:two-component system, OmpR family, KDP operon response regulator KdpE